MRSSSVVEPNAIPEIRSSKTRYVLMVIIGFHSSIDTRKYENVRSIIVDLTLLFENELLTDYYCTTNRLVTTKGLPSGVVPLTRTKYTPRMKKFGFTSHVHFGFTGLELKS